MSNDLSKMTLEQLWQLFPIQLKPHNPDYAQWFKYQRHQLLDCIPHQYIHHISHIGSTAVPGLTAKPIVDILLEVTDDCDAAQLQAALKQDGWILMWDEGQDRLNQSYNKGYTPDGFAQKVYHLHVRRLGDWDELYFRDYLLEHPQTAREYAELKQGLLAEFTHNRDGYTQAKTDFVRRYSALARQLYPGRYLP